MTDQMAFPPSDEDGGWQKEDPRHMGIDTQRLEDAVRYHENHPDLTKTYGGALVVIYRGNIVAETYTTGSRGGPQPWSAATCNDMCSSTKSVFGTAVGVFLEEFKGRISLETELVGKSRETSLLPQIWDQPLTDKRKGEIKIKHVLSMTSGHATDEPWSAPATRHHYPGYTGAHQMYEYCFGWWYFKGVASQKTLLFKPGEGFNYSNFGLEQLALAMRNLTGEEIGPYTYERVLQHIGISSRIKDVRYKVMPDLDQKALNYSEQAGWGRGGGKGCDAYGADRSESPYGYNTIVGSSLRCTARDFARLGYLWLRAGRWGNRQLVSRDWIQSATQRFKRDNGEAPENYGYTFWILDDWEGVPDDAYMSRGYNINDCYVVPSLELVVVRQGNANKSRQTRLRFSKTLLRKIVSAIPA